MRFDNGVFALYIPAGWDASEAEDGSVYVTSKASDDVWVSIEPGGVNTNGKTVSAADFARSVYSAELQTLGATTVSRSDGRVVLGWQRTQVHNGTNYELTHALAAWNESPTNIQLLMFQAACPQNLSDSPCGNEARAFAQAAASNVHFYSWREEK